jgi:protease I
MFITGGRAPEYLRYDQDLMAITRHFFATGKPVACVCHGVEIIAAADVIRGKRLATVAKCQYDAEFSGGIYVNERCVRDGNLVTGRTWHDNPYYMREFMKMLAEARQQTPAGAVAGTR